MYKFGSSARIQVKLSYVLNDHVKTSGVKQDEHEKSSTAKQDKHEKPALQNRTSVRRRVREDEQCGTK